MKNGRRIVVLGAASIGLVGLAGSPAMAASHSWRINEIFSNADGTIQFIEMKECCGFDNETGLLNKWVRSKTTRNMFIFPANLVGPTGHKHLLLATAAFATLPGAPTPDYIIPAGFFAIEGDSIEYWFYTAATLTFGPGELPTDCITSLHDGGDDPNFTGPNSPTNYADETGSINACPCPWDLDGSGSVGASDLLSLLVSWGPCKGCPADFDGNGTVGASDLLALLVNWGPCP
ncbi:MAG: hypothetical protein V3T84_01620 [Phycisphaerales bacterium]